ncbi:MAG: DUF4465 domain-containing protein [Opitutales bacterium]|nr:DUF4465 domain-containing protein [Opitutales bacterium]
MKNKIMALGLAFSALCSLNAAVVTFEDVDLGANKYMEPAVADQSSSNDWSSGAVAYFSYDYTWWGTYSSWQGFKVSKDTDTSTKDYTNQYSSITGSGAGGSSQYGILYALSSNMTLDSSTGVATTDMSIMSFEKEVQISSIDFANTTYSYYSMLEGDGYAASPILGSEYYMNLIIYGINVEGDISGMITWSMGSGMKISKTWETVDLSALGGVIGLGFAIETNYTSDYTLYGSGICANYPSYVAFDNLAYNIPEPSTCALIFGGLAISIAVFRRRKSK